MTHRIPARSLCLAAFLLLSSTSSLLAQGGDAQTVFLEGKHAFRTGDLETALAKFREVVQLDPSHAEAYQMLAKSHDFLAQLMAQGGEFETFALEVLEAARAGGAEKRRDAEAAAELAQTALTGDYAARSRAIFEGSQLYGAFFAPPLVAALADPKEDVRLNAYYALSRMGVDALVPVLAASNSTNTEVRRGAVQVLLEIGDPRADARLADMAAGDADGTVRALARAATGDAGDLHFAQGWAYYSGDPARGLTEVENFGVLWNIDGKELMPFDVPAPLVPLELARHHFERAVELGRAGALPALALVHAAEAAVLAASEMGEEEQGHLVAALSLGPAALDGALGLALKRGDVPSAAVLAALLTGPAAGSSPSLRGALASDAPVVRHAAAIALARSGDSSGEVVAQLAAGMKLEAVRVVQIMDSDASRAAALAASLDAQGVVALVAADGVDGLVNASRGLGADVFVIADPLPDYYASRLVKHLRRMARYEETPILVIGGEATGDLDGAEVVEAVTAEDVTNAFGEFDAERQGYLAAATAAAEAMAYLAANDPGAAAPATTTLVGVLDREDQVAVPAMRALSHAGSAESAPALVGVIADTGRSIEARVAGAEALAGVLSRNPGAGSGGVRAALEAAIAEGEPALARACAMALGFLGGGGAAQ